MSDIPVISRDELPSDLRSRLASSTEPAVIRHHQESKREAPPRWLLLPLVALASFGALCAALIPAAPFTQLASIALFIGAGLLGAVIGGSRQQPLRPEEGQRLLVGSASLALVHRDHVEILPAESIRIGDDGQLHFRGSPFDGGGHDPVWMSSLRKAIEAASRNETDSWRDASKMETPTVNRGTHRAIGAGLGLVIALGIELVPLAGTSGGGWAALHHRVDSHHEWVLAQEQALHDSVKAEFDQQLPTIKTTMGAISLLLDVQVRGLGEEYEGPTKDKLHTLALAELAAAKDTQTVEPLIRMALAGQIRPSFLVKAKQRYSELVEAELNANPSVESFRTFLVQVRALHLGDEVKATVVLQVTRLGNAALASAKKQEEVAPYLRLCLAHNLGDEFCEPVHAQFAVLARRQLVSKRISEEEFTDIESLVAQADLGEDFEKPLRLRRRLLALRSITEATTGTQLDAAATAWLDRVASDYREVLESRLSDRAKALAKRASTSQDTAKLFPFLPEDEHAELFERYKEMAAEEARTGSIDDARAFLGARDFSAHPDRQTIEERLLSLCRGAYEVEDSTDDGSVGFFSALLGEMCIRDTSNLTYRIGGDIVGYGSNRVTNVADAAPELAEVATEMATLLGRPIQVRHRESKSNALIELEVDGFPSLGEMTYPCTLKISRRYEASGPKSMEIEATCSRVWEP